MTNIITNDHETIRQSKAILLPGVGSFRQGMDNLKKRNLIEVLTNEVVFKQKPFLGICLGMQLIMEKGSEPTECDGLGWIKGSVNKFNNLNLTIPHMGWNNVEVLNNKYFNNLQQKDFYFVHSYHVSPENLSDISSTVFYGKNIVSSITKNNIFATQFHPEKSQKDGLQLLQNFFIKHA